MARRRNPGSRRRGLGTGLTPRGRAVMKAFQEARRHAPGFIVSCGLLPEVSESATERLHSIVRDVADRHLDGGRHLQSMRRTMRASTGSAVSIDRLERTLTELIGSEATAAYVFGLAVGLTIQALPERLRDPRR